MYRISCFLLLFIASPLHAEKAESNFTIPAKGITLTLPGLWEERKLASDEVVFAAVQTNSANTIGILAFKPPSPDISPTHEGIEKGLSDAIAGLGVVTQRNETTLFGKRAYALTAEIDSPQLKGTIIRIFPEGLVNGCFYAVQYSILDSKTFPTRDLDTLASFVKLKAGPSANIEA